MTSPAAFQATYSDFRLVRSRKVVQIVLEVPLEAANSVLETLGGMPNPGAETWVAVARLNAKEVMPPESKSKQPDTKPAPVAPARANPISRLTRQAGIFCTDPVFWKFLHEHNMMQEPMTGFEGEEAATLAVRMICGVQSRKEIIPGTPAGEAWETLVSKFTAWRIAA